MRFQSAAILAQLFLCVHVLEKKNEERERESKEPQGEMAYLLQTTSQGHSRRGIKLQRTSEGVRQDL